MFLGRVLAPLPWYPRGSQNLLQMHVYPIFGPEDDLWYHYGNLGRVWVDLEATQGQGQGHLHLIHGKLLPNAVPGERVTSALIAAFIPSHPELTDPMGGLRDLQLLRAELI